VTSIGVAFMQPKGEQAMRLYTSRQPKSVSRDLVVIAGVVIFTVALLWGLIHP